MNSCLSLENISLLASIFRNLRIARPSKQSGMQHSTMMSSGQKKSKNEMKLLPDVIVVPDKQ